MQVFPPSSAAAANNTSMFNSSSLTIHTDVQKDVIKPSATAVMEPEYMAPGDPDVEDEDDIGVSLQRCGLCFLASWGQGYAIRCRCLVMWSCGCFVDENAGRLICWMSWMGPVDSRKHWQCELMNRSSPFWMKRIILLCCQNSMTALQVRHRMLLELIETVNQDDDQESLELFDALGELDFNFDDDSDEH